MNFPITCVVVEDEREQREHFLKILKNFPKIKVVGTAKGVKSAYELINEKKPDAAFLDIEIQEGDAFMLLEKLKANGCKIPTSVIVSGYPKYAVKSYDYHSNIVYFLTKPIQLDKERRIEKAIDAIIIELSKQENKRKAFQKDHFFIRKDNYHIRIDLDKLFYIEASGGTICLVMENKKIKLNKSLNMFLEEHPFYILERVSRQTAINILKIETVDSFESIATIFLNGEMESIGVGMAYYQRLINKLNEN